MPDSSHDIRHAWLFTWHTSCLPFHMTHVQHILAIIFPSPSKQEAVHIANLILPSRNLILGGGGGGGIIAVFKQSSSVSRVVKWYWCTFYVLVSTFRHSWLLISALFMLSTWLRPLPTTRISWSDLIRKLTPPKLLPFRLTTDLPVVEASKATKKNPQAQKSTLSTTIIACQIQHVQKISENVTDEKLYF